MQVIKSKSEEEPQPPKPPPPGFTPETIAITKRAIFVAKFSFAVTNEKHTVKNEE